MLLENSLKKILIIDFGSQFTQLIARKVRELGVYCEILSHHKSNNIKLFDKNVSGLILSGGPLNVYQSKKVKFNKNLLKRVEELELSVRSMNCLKNDNIIYIGDLVQKSESEMLRTPNFGRKSLNEIKEVLTGMSLYLGMEIPNWPPDNIAELSKKLEEAI